MTMKEERETIVRLTSAIHKIGCPQIGMEKTQLSFTRSFKSVGSHPSAQALTNSADMARSSLTKALVQGSIDPSSVVECAEEYLPLIRQLILTCQVQPDVARLDERLIFEWASGIEKLDKKTKRKCFYFSEAMMYDMVMTTVSLAMGKAGLAHNENENKNYVSAARGFKEAAGIFKFLAEEHRPNWIDMGANASSELPAESSIGACEAFKVYFLGVGQQMAIATALSKSTPPNYSLLAKLCLGVSEQMESFLSTMKAKVGTKVNSINVGLIEYATFQMNLQRCLYMYFLARSTWEENVEYGLAIAMLKDAMNTPLALPTGHSASLKSDVADFQTHMNTLVRMWTVDNDTVFYKLVPTTIPKDKKLSSGLLMIKPEVFELRDVPVAQLMMPTSRTPLTSIFQRIKQATRV